MLFNSVEFLWFLPIVFILYWLLNSNLRLQNFLLLVASYIFYGWWDWRFLSLISASILIDYIAAINIHHSGSKAKKRMWLTLSITTNLGLLGFFKYYNFFVDSFIAAVASLGYEMSPWTLNIILPVGISFYTFQTMAYTIDVYKKRIEACNDLVTFAAFVSFFPQLVAGPIERASHLLPQLTFRRKFSYIQSVQGLRLILWGLFKKVVIADSLAVAVDSVFDYTRAASGSSILFGVFYFSFQIYCDFSGYSDIAIGTSKLFGIELMSNFRFPYFSRNLLEFWQRWHISLSTWFRDYVYIPLGGSRNGLGKAVRNIIIVFLVSGLWHGADITFLAWGAIHALLYIPVFIYYKSGRNMPVVKRVAQFFNRLPFVNITRILVTFCAVAVAWLFFRSETIEQAVLMFKKMLFMVSAPFILMDYLWYVVVLLCIELFIRKDERNPMPVKNRFLRYLYYSALIILIVMHCDNSSEEFIYFRF